MPSMDKNNLDFRSHALVNSIALKNGRHLSKTNSNSH